MEASIREDESRQKATVMAKAMKAKGYKVEEIAELTGLSKSSIGKLKTN